VLPRATVIVRAKDSERTIERTLSALRAQTVPVEIVVVDSGSADRTPEVARRHCDRLIEIPPGEFSFGRALNIGARTAAAPFHFALSSHAAPDRADWVERSLAHYEDPRVAGTGGYPEPAPNGGTGTVIQDLALLRAEPWWGYSNTAGSWRGELWERFPFDERLAAAEDREWSWRVLEAGYLIAMDPELEVRSGHRLGHGLRPLFRRVEREARVIGGLDPGAPYGPLDALRDWWAVTPTDRRSAMRIRSSPWHIAAVLGRHRGIRSARRAGGR
jgi:rhamnosyltransferase